MHHKSQLIKALEGEMKVVGEIKFRRAIATLYFPFDVAELASQQGLQ